jgi:hypothetical protein
LSTAPLAYTPPAAGSRVAPPPAPTTRNRGFQVPTALKWVGAFASHRLKQAVRSKLPSGAVRLAELAVVGLWAMLFAVVFFFIFLTLGLLYTMSYNTVEGFTYFILAFIVCPLVFVVGFIFFIVGLIQST